MKDGFEKFSQYLISKKNSKYRSRFGILSIFAALGIITIPFLAFAKTALELVRMPETTESGNSQTMELLSGYLNSNPTSIGGGTVVIVDNMALEAGRIGGETFVELGESGTGQINVHVVHENETLSGIAEMFGVSINTIIWANDLRGSTIKEGQELLILPISGVRHIVKSGDTLQSIAKSYKADLDDILSYNDFSTDSKIKIGDIIIIPNGIISASANIKSSLTQISSSLPTYSGYYLRPITGGRKSQGIHGYNAVDLAAPVGTSIKASAGGTVILARTAGYNGGYGLYVVIKHPNGTQTLYAHMSRVNVVVGEQVSQGEVIGAVGNTGRSTGPHIHFEVRGARNPF